MILKAYYKVYDANGNLLMSDNGTFEGHIEDIQGLVEVVLLDDSESVQIEFVIDEDGNQYIF